MNLYGEGESTFGEPTYIVGFTVPPQQAFRLTTLIGWGDTPTEFEIAINGEKVAGCRTAPEARTVQVWWENSITANEGDLVGVSATHYSQGSRAMRCNLILTRA